MNKIKLLPLLLLLFLVFQTKAQSKLQLGGNNKAPLVISQKKSNNFSIHFNISELNLNNFETNDGIFTEIQAAGFGKTYTQGEPDLPVFVQIISVPQNVNLSMAILNSTKSSYDLSNLGYNNFVKPAIHSISKSDDVNKIEYKLGKVYTEDSYNDMAIVELHEIGIMRELKLYELVYNPVVYNPVKHKIEIRNNIDVSLNWLKDSFDGSNWDFINTHNHTNSIEAASKYSEVNETYVIVSPLKYSETLEPFIKWKKQKGYTVIQAYIGEDIATNDKNVIKDYLKNLYENPEDGMSAPTYVLIVGDVIDIPAWSGKTDSHVTDLYYAEYTGDYLPEVYYGRFSVTTTEQLQSIIYKTLYVEKGMGNTSYQNNHLLVSGVDSDFAPVYGNGALRYLLKYYSTEDFGITPNYYLYGSGSPITSNNSQAKQAILDDFSAGTGIAYYTAHCSVYGWSNPEFETSDISGINNKDKYPLMIGNCCESMKFNQNSFGEEIVRVKEKGAVAYIGASNFSYWDEDYFWGVGFTSNIVSDPNYENTDLGAFDAWFHSHNENEEDRAYTVGQILNVGNMAVQSSSSDLRNYYWEVYHIMGDPSLVPAKYQTEKISATYNPIMAVGQTKFAVETEPYAVVSLSENNNLLAVSAANANGLCTINFMPLTQIGENRIEMVVSLPDFAPRIDSLNVIAPDGPYLVSQGIEIDDSEGNNNGRVDFGEKVLIYFNVENFGSESAENTKIIFSTNSDWIEEDLLGIEIQLGTIQANESVTSNQSLAITLKDNVPNKEVLEFKGTFIYGDNKTKDFNFSITANAPEITAIAWKIDESGIGNHDGIIEADESVSVVISFSNVGTAKVSNTIFSFESANSEMLQVIFDTLQGGDFSADTTKQIEVQIKGGVDIFSGDIINLKYKIEAGETGQYLYSGFLPIVLGAEPEYLMSNNTHEIITGYFYDAGGPNENYSSNEDYLLTFLPHNSHQGLMIDFIDFEVESSSNGCYDKLYIYDGMDENAPLLGKFCSNNVQLAVQSQNDAGALTFRFTSDGGVVKQGWKGYVSSSEKYKVTLKITDGINLIDSAEVQFVNIIDTTLNGGVVVFANTLAISDKRYTINKLGYLDYTGTIGEINSDTTITILIQKLPDICFTVFEDQMVLPNASITFDNRTIVTDENGFANFIDIMPGSKNFKVWLDGYDDTTGIIVVNDIDVCYSIQLHKTPTYTARFLITDEFGLLENASVEINNVFANSGVDGIIDFEGLCKGTYNYEITKQGYNTLLGVIDVFSDTLIAINFKHIPYAVSLNVMGTTGNALEGALITINNETLQTSIEGTVVFDSIVPAQGIAFTIFKEGFNIYNGTFDLVDKDIEFDVVLIMLGMTDEIRPYLTVYPNPLTSSRALTLISANKIDKIEVINYEGRQIYSEELYQNQGVLMLTDLKAGVYVLQVMIHDKRYFKKIILE